MYNLYYSTHVKRGQSTDRNTFVESNAMTKILKFSLASKATVCRQSSNELG